MLFDFLGWISQRVMQYICVLQDFINWAINRILAVVMIDRRSVSHMSGRVSAEHVKLHRVILRDGSSEKIDNDVGAFFFPEPARSDYSGTGATRLLRRCAFSRRARALAALPDA